MVLQEHSHPFGPEEDFFEAVSTLNEWIREAGSKPVIYMTWARENEEEEQERMTCVHKQAADRIDALIAPVGENWWDYKRSWPDIVLYHGTDPGGRDTTWDP